MPRHLKEWMPPQVPCMQAKPPQVPRIHAMSPIQGRQVSYGPHWAHYLGGYQDRLLGGPLRLPD
jgi:hypothetical protein